MKLAMIVAVAENGVIGSDNKLPWHLPEDLKYFKRVTMGKPIVMGRKTWDSIGRPLPGRTNIVITRQSGLQLEGAKVVATIEEALELAQAVATIDGAEELVVIGGAEIYQAAFPLCQRLYLTEVHAEVTGDACFPAWQPDQWLKVSEDHYSSDETNPFNYSFVVYERDVSSGTSK